MALNIALSKLQVALGPDQRISVSSSILDTSPDTAEIDGLAHNNNMLMVYDSWDTHLQGKKYLRDVNGEPTSNSITISDTYKTGRHQDLFKKYLISHTDDAALQNMQAAVDSNVLKMTGANSVTLVSPVGKDDADYDSRNNLTAGLIPINNNKGSIAWGVVGKNLPSISTYEEESTIAGLAGESNSACSPKRYAVNVMNGASAFPDDRLLAHKLCSLNELDVVTDPSVGRKNFFHLSGVNSYSILSDVRNGGLKKDINLFMDSDWGDFSSSSVHPDYKTVNLQTAEVEMPLCGIEAVEALSPSNPNIPPTSWRQLRDFYRLYKDTHSYAPSSMQWDGSVPTVDYLVTGEHMDPGWGGHHHQFQIPDTLGYHRSPVMSRFIYLVGLSSEASGSNDVKLYVHVSPVLVLWNPFNVTLRIPEGQPVPGTSTPLSDFNIQAALNRALEVDTKITVLGLDGTQINRWINSAETGLGRLDQVSSHFDDVSLSNGPSSSSNEVIFKPGEVRIFSMQKPVGTGANVRVHLSPGFNNNVLLDERLRRDIATIPKTHLSSAKFALRFSKSTQNTLWGSPELPLAYGGDSTCMAFDSYGTVIGSDGGAKTSLSPKAPRGPRGGIVMDWFTTKGAEIVKDSASHAVKFPTPGSKPQPVAMFGLSLKGVEEYDEDDSSLESSKPVANRTWLHSNPTQLWRHLFNPTPLKRAAFPYEIMYTTSVGNGVAELLQSDGNNAFMGPSIGAAGVKHFTYQELPISPISSLAGFGAMRLTHGRPVTPSFQSSTGLTFGPNTQHISHWGAAFGCGIGNSFAHPMSPGDTVYKKHSNFTNFDSKPIFDDHYDTLLLANDSLYDGWFCSSIAEQTTPAYDSSKSAKQVAKDLISGSTELPNQRIKLATSSLTEAELETEFDKVDAYKTIASHLQVQAGFNINNPHPEAWKALLHGLKDRQIPYIDAATGARGLSEKGKGLALSRFRLANSDAEGTDETDPASWTGIRYLTDDQIDTLAEQIARQVKLRGPFLNMSEFINRRLSNDKFGVCGALQAAIDHDDFDSGFLGAPSGSSAINSHLKSDIVTPTVSYEFPLAAKGSAYTGITGYVMQSDLLKAMGNTLTPRDDTFVIRAYGDSRDSNGKILARSWCEATVQRTPQYVEPDSTDNSLDKAPYSSTFNSQPVATSLSETNRRLGRKFKITSFRWLSANEVN